MKLPLPRILPAPVSRLAAALALLLPAACFTEVGNPDGPAQATASFTVDYGGAPAAKAAVRASADTAPALRIDHFQLPLREVEYHTSLGRTYHLWTSDSLGSPVDFTGRDSALGVPTVDIPREYWDAVAVEFGRGRRAGEADPDSAVRDPGYLSGYLAAGGDAIPFFFPLPEAPEWSLDYGHGRLKPWRHGDSYAIQVVFSVPRWLAGVRLDSLAVTRDSLGRRTVWLDSLRNPDAFAKLRANFPSAFDADSITTESGDYGHRVARTGGTNP